MTESGLHGKPAVGFRSGLRAFLIIAASFVIWMTPPAILQWLRWTDSQMAGLIVILFVDGLVWLVLVLPVTLLCRVISRNRPKLRTFLLSGLLPAIVFSVCANKDRRFSRPTLDELIYDRTGTHAPDSAHDVRLHYHGGLSFESENTYYFRCDRADTERLIGALKLTLLGKPAGFARPDASWPDAASWKGVTVFESETEQDGGAIQVRTLVTDAERGQVLLTFRRY